MEVLNFDPSQYHHFSHGRMSCGLCVAAWQLTDVQPGDGGFACIPGSHKSNIWPPQSVSLKTTSAVSIKL